MDLTLTAASDGLSEIVFGFAQPPRQLLDCALSTMQRALQLNDQRDVAYAVYSMILSYALGRLTDAAVAARSALDFNQDYTPRLCSLAVAKLFEGDYAASIENSTRAYEIDNRDLYATW